MINQTEAQAQLAALFQSAATITQDQLVTTGGGGGGIPGVFEAPGALLTRVPAARVDGVTVLPNDEELRVQVSVLAEGIVLKPGDSFLGEVDNLHRTVITAHLDALGILWTCVVRREY